MTADHPTRIKEIRQVIADYRESVTNDERVRPMAGWVDLMFLFDLVVAQQAALEEATKHEQWAVSEVLVAADVEAEILRRERDEARARVELFKTQLSTQEARTGEWHQACEAAEARCTTAFKLVDEAK